MTLNYPKFHGSRLREAREARALSQVALAQLVGVSSPAISQYESEEHSPSPQVMSRICEVLNLPPQFFMAPAIRQSTSSLFWRSRAAATKRRRESHEWQYNWFRDV